MRLYKASSPEGDAALRDVVERRNASNENALRVADAMIAGVRARGDAYVAEQIAKFDGVTLAPEAIKIAPRNVAPASSPAGSAASSPPGDARRVPAGRRDAGATIGDDI